MTKHTRAVHPHLRPGGGPAARETGAAEVLTDHKEQQELGGRQGV